MKTIRYYDTDWHSEESAIDNFLRVKGKIEILYGCDIKVIDLVKPFFGSIKIKFELLENKGD